MPTIVETKESLLTDTISDEQLYLIKYHSYGTIQMTIEWLLNPHKMSATDFAHMQFLAMPDFLKQAYLSMYKKSGVHSILLIS